jgi:hypothetical protein
MSDLLAARVARLLRDNPPSSTDRLDFLRARFDAGLACPGSSRQSSTSC